MVASYLKRRLLMHFKTKVNVTHRINEVQLFSLINNRIPSYTEQKHCLYSKYVDTTVYLCECRFGCLCLSLVRGNRGQLESTRRQTVKSP